MEDRIISLNGHDTRVIVGGSDGPAILMLHGFPEHAGGWRPLIAKLADRHQCFAPDQRGYGTSYRPDGVENYTTGKIVKDLLGLIETLDLDRVHIVGHDWGAATAYGLGFSADPRIASLTILNGVHPVLFQRELAKGEDQAAASQYMTWLRRPDSHEKLAANNFEKLASFFAHGMDMSWLTGATLEEYRAAWGGPDRGVETVNAMVNWYRASPLVVPETGKALHQEDLPALPQERLRVKVPHMLIWGMGDTALLPGSREGLEDFCDAGLEVHEINYADHWVVHQQPAKCAELLAGFVARVDAG
ncbi:MAG: alpha/beta hydrolase [Pseudomonadota bacterium]